MTLEVLAHAKVNLSLDILGKREDGYHQVEMVMQSISLADRVRLVPLPEKGKVTLACNHPDVPQGEEAEANLAVKAVRLLERETGWLGGVAIEIEKSVPVAAGLAGGSSNAAAVLTGMNRLFNLGMEDKDLLELGARLGSDVPFCIRGGTALAQGRGEILTPLEKTPELWMVLVKPPFGVSTADAYKNFRMDEAKGRPDTRKLLAALAEDDRPSLLAAMGNVLERVTTRLYPEVGVLKERLERLGAHKAMMSGSGPTVFGIVADRGHGEAIARELREEYSEVFVASTWREKEEQ